MRGGLIYPVRRLLRKLVRLIRPPACNDTYLPQIYYQRQLDAGNGEAAPFSGFIGQLVEFVYLDSDGLDAPLRGRGILLESGAGHLTVSCGQMVMQLSRSWLIRLSDFAA